MKRLLYYVKLALLDLIRHWSGTQHHVIIVAGIVLPLMLLMGLKRGHVAELRAELLRSPTGRQIVIWSTRRDALLDFDTIDSLTEDIPDVELVIPESERIVQIANVSASLAPDTLAEPVGITIYPTRKGDPILAQAGCDVLDPAELAIVLSESVCESLGVQLGSSVEITISRSGIESREQQRLQLKVAKILAEPAEKNAIGYVEVGLLNLIEQWVRGGGAARFGWAASNRPAPDRYDSYLVFLEKPNRFSDDDLRAIADRGLVLTSLTDEPEASLHGLIDPLKRERLDAWRLASDESLKKPERRLAISPSDVEGITSADDMVVAWNQPRSLNAAGPLLIGLTIPKRSRLRHEFLRDSSWAFLPSEDTREVILPDWELPSSGNETITIPLSGTAQLVLTVRQPIAPESQIEAEPFKPAPTELAPEQENKKPVQSQLAIVPVQLLARLDCLQSGLAVYDEPSGVIVQAPDGAIYGKARIYASNIDKVPTTVASLTKMGFAVLSETGRITEIHQQDSSLQVLVIVVGTGVLLFGIITVFSVLLDSTDRKRGTIGILRVMGVTRFGIFLMVVLRAGTIGILAGALSIAAGWLTSCVLLWNPPVNSVWSSFKPVVSVAFDPLDLMLVVGGAVICSCVGAMIPAWRAARIDPFDAIVEGRFK
jgi:ABC-type lipoprotein release transport system permease subunit